MSRTNKVHPARPKNTRYGKNLKLPAHQFARPTLFALKALPEYRFISKNSPVFRSEPVKMLSSKRTPFQLPPPRKRNELLKAGFKLGLPPIYIPEARRPVIPFLPRASQAYFEYKHPTVKDLIQRFSSGRYDMYDPSIQELFQSQFFELKSKVKRKRFIGDDHTRKLGARYRRLLPPGKYSKKDKDLPVF